MKGEKGGNCNRTACQEPNAIYYNHSTKKYYCKKCADIINEQTEYDSYRMFGHALCILDDDYVPGKMHDDALLKIKELLKEDRMNPSMGPPLLTKKEEKLTKRIKELESAINSFIEIEEFDFEDYEYKNLVEKFIKTFKELLKED